MNADTAREMAHRLINRDQAIRAAQKVPPWNSVRQILDFVCQRNLLSDPVVADWLRTLTNNADFWFKRRLLEVVATLLDGQHAAQAHSLYRAILGVDDEATWTKMAPTLVSDSWIVQAAIEPILGRTGLLAGHAPTWGRTACELLGRIVLEHQKNDWPSHMHFRAILAEQFGEPFDANQPFQIQEDDGPSLWYFPPDRLDAPRVRFAMAVHAALHEAAQLPNADVFRLFADWLIEQTFAIGTGLVLVVLLDGMTGKLPTQSWHADEAARLLVRDGLHRHHSLSSLRRLLRRTLPRPEEPTSSALTEVIRRSKLPEQVQLRELGDIAAWGTLTPEEQGRLADISAGGAFEVPSDPRQEPLVHHGEPVGLPHSYGGLAWPHSEDDWAIKELSATYRVQEFAPGETVDPAKLDRRLQALQALIGRSACNSEPWLGEILGWCHDIVSLMRRDELTKKGRDPEKDPLSAAEWRDVLNARAPWWKERVEAALAVLVGNVPNHHRERKSGALSWGSSDPFLQSFAYLDNILAVDGEDLFAQFRLRMESAIDDSWPSWPSFTRATALSVLRGWYWNHLTRLRARLTQLAVEESDPLVLKPAVERLLRLSGSDYAENLGRFLARAAQIESSGEMVNQLSKAIGNAYLYGRGQANPGERVHQLSELFLRVQQAPPEYGPTRENLIKGILFGMLDLFRNHQYRTEARVHAWAATVVWACSSWRWSDAPNEGPEHFPVIPITAVLVMRWPEGLRKRALPSIHECFLRLVRDGNLADFCWLHHEIRGLLCGHGQAANSEDNPLEKGDYSDEKLIELCRASAERLKSWRASGTRTQDLGWGSALTGHETADLIRAVINAGSDRAYLRRELPPIIDRLTDVGVPGIATELRLLLRRG